MSMELNELEIMKKNIILMIQEQKALQNEIDTLNKNIQRKDEIVTGFYEIIMNTKNIELSKQAELIILKANFGDKTKGV